MGIAYGEMGVLIGSKIFGGCKPDNTSEEYFPNFALSKINKNLYITPENKQWE